MVIPIVFINSVIYASLISLMSMGFTLTFLTSKIPNFAHGTYAGIGIYIVFTITRVMGLNPYFSLPLSFLIGSLFGITIYIVIIRTLQKKFVSEIVLTISTIAIQIFMSSLIYIYAWFIRSIKQIYIFGFLLKMNDFRWLGYQGILYVAPSVCIVTGLLLHALLTRTKIGIAMRATAENSNLASYMGIDIYKTKMLVWFLSGGIACLVGSLLPFWFQSSPGTASTLMLSCMAGSLLGGLNSIYGGIIGGFCMGGAEILLTTWLMRAISVQAGEYRPMIPMIVVVAVLLFEPGGLNRIFERISTSKFNLFSRG